MAAPDASAGTYSAPVYSGGTWKDTNPPYNSGSGSYRLAGNSYGASLDDKITNGSLICQGTITAVFTWQPDYTGDLPPASVIIAQTSGASCTTTASPGVTAQASDGLNDPQTGSWYSSGTHYMVIPGTQTITLNKCSPMASIITTQKHEIMASVGYTAAIYFPKVTLIGENITTNQALSGQQIQANLIMTNGLPSGTKIKSYTWSFTGATAPNPIKDWVGTNIPDQLVPLIAADLTGTDTTGNGISVSPVSFYDQIADKKVIVNCAVNLSFPDSTTATINAQSIPVSFVVPTASWVVGQSVDNANPGFVFDNVLHNEFYANETWGPITITEPPALVPDGPGTGCIVQIANPSRSFTRTPQNGKPAVYSKMLVSFGSNITGMVASPTGLDSDFPYSIGYILSGNGSWTVVRSNYTWAANTAGYSGDAPTQPFTTGDQDGGGTQWYSSTADDGFYTWVMYRPPPYFTGQGTIYIPLQVLNWSWGGSANLNTMTHVWSGGPGPPLVQGSASNWSTPPAWSLVIPSPLTFGP